MHFFSNRSDKFRVNLPDRSHKYLSDLSDKFAPQIYANTYRFLLFFVRLLPSGAEFQPGRLFGDGRRGGAP